VVSGARFTVSTQLHQNTKETALVTCLLMDDGLDD
jgi:hypothetical protein